MCGKTYDFSYIIIMRSTHASFVVNRICLPWRDFLAPSGLRGGPRGHEGACGGGGGWSDLHAENESERFFGLCFARHAC